MGITCAAIVGGPSRVQIAAGDGEGGTRVVAVENASGSMVGKCFIDLLYRPIGNHC